jgi:hypothetical protein
VVAAVTAAAGSPRASGWLFLATGAVIVAAVGRLAGLAGRGVWVRAAIGALAVMVGIGAIAISMWAMAGCPWVARAC